MRGRPRARPVGRPAGGSSSGGGGERDGDRGVCIPKKSAASGGRESHRHCGSEARLWSPLAGTGAAVGPWQWKALGSVAGLPHWVARSVAAEARRAAGGIPGCRRSVRGRRWRSQRPRGSAPSPAPQSLRARRAAAARRFPRRPTRGAQVPPSALRRSPPPAEAAGHAGRRWMHVYDANRQPRHPIQSPSERERPGRHASAPAARRVCAAPARPGSGGAGPSPRQRQHCARPGGPLPSGQQRQEERAATAAGP